MNSWVVETLASSTLLMLLVLAIRRPVARLLGARTAYALWALPALRLLLPPLPGWTTLYVPVAHHGPDYPVALGLVDHQTAALLATDIAAPLPGAIAPAIAATFDFGQGLPLLIGLWEVGAAVWFGWQMWRYRRFMAEALATADPLTRVGGVEVLITPAVAGPMAAGIRHPRILLPADFTSRYTAEERRLALLHEGAHHDRGDLIANLVGLAVVAVHWWNPVAHLAYRAFRRDQELACDASVLAGSSADTRVAYGRAVIKSACSRTPAAACAMNHKSQLKQRIAMMKTSHEGAARAVSGGLFAILAIGGGLLLSASGSAPGADDMPPVAPIAPVAPAAPTAPVAPVAPPREAAPVAAPAPAAPPEPAVWRSQPVAIQRSNLSDADRRERRNAEREVRRAEQEARRADQEARRAAEAADRAAREAGRRAEAAVRAMDIQHTVRHALAAARNGMVARCAEAGVTVTRETDPANCDAAFRQHIRQTVHHSLQVARISLRASHGLAENARHEALRGIDEAIVESDRELATPIG